MIESLEDSLLAYHQKEDTMEGRERLRLLAKDLTRDFPRSPHDTLAGYVIACRTLDKCRALLNGTIGEYHFNCPLDQEFFRFTGIDPEEFKDFVATGATDEEVAEWIEKKAVKRDRIEVIRWNNRMRYMRISELPDELQEFLEDYIPRYIPRNRRVYYWFDVYDIEEQRI